MQEFMKIMVQEYAQFPQLMFDWISFDIKVHPHH